MNRSLIVFALFAAFATQLACKVNDYCLNCAKGDANGDGNGTGDGGGSDGSGGDAGCIPSGPEICDGKDNDCNGLVDDNPVDANQPCMNQKGVCAGGVTVCTNGTLGCTKNPSPEICDGLDNDCNGLTDEGDPGGGGFCGSGVGTCMKGVNHCINGSIQCFGAVGPQPEICDAQDNDCDGMFDEDVMYNPPTCGTSNVGECKFGMLMCQGGATICVGAVNATFEICDGKDNDCDGTIDEGYNTQTDPQNCGMCGHVCNLPNAVAGCSAGSCVIASCDAGFHDNNGIASDGCEFGPCFPTGIEVCDGTDNDCDGVIDEDIGNPPGICATKGECAGTVAQCMGTQGWVCNYGMTVSTDGMGNIIPETLCDGLDNDCNGIIDDHQPNKGQACDDGKQGACKSTGTYQCDPNNLNGPAICTITTQGATPQPESCNNIDDDCDGVVDNPTSPGVYPGGGLTWVNIGGGHQMMQFEASEPDASASATGNITTGSCGSPSTVAASPGGATESATTATITTTAAHKLAVGNVVVISGVGVAGYNGTYVVASVPASTKFTIPMTVSGLAASGGGTVTPVCPTCSKSGVQPWIDITYPQAVAACAAVGATLCSEQQWHRTCSVIAPTSYPISVPGGTFSTTIEAEDYSSIAYNTSGGVTYSWVEDYLPGFSGISAMLANPNTGATLTAANAITQAPRLDYQLNVAAGGPYRVCVRGYSSRSADNTVWVGINPSLPGNSANLKSISTPSNNAWGWMGPSAQITVAAGTNYLSLYMEEDGLHVDQVYLTNGNTCPGTTTINPAGNTWAYATSPNTYQANTCNGLDHGVNAPVATGSLASCYANDGASSHVFDMSGNVKEWVLAHQPGENPIRGGAFDNTSTGIDCALDFTLADDTFFFNNVGFRCCK